MQSVETGGPLGLKQSRSRPQIFLLYRGNMIQRCTEATKGSDVFYKFKLLFLTVPQKADPIQERTPRSLPSCIRHFLSSTTSSYFQLASHAKDRSVQERVGAPPNVLQKPPTQHNRTKIHAIWDGGRATSRRRSSAFLQPTKEDPLWFSEVST